MKYKVRHVEVPGIQFCSLEEILEHLRVLKINPKYFNRLKIENDYGACWYEGDEPSVKLVGDIPL